MFSRFVAVLAAVVCFAPAAPAAPPNKDVAEVLSWVPPDAAVFVHVDVQAVWKSPQMLNVRKDNPAGIFDQLDVIAGALGVAPESVQTFTLFLPKVKGSGDQEAVCMAVTLAKPYKPQQIVTALATLAGLGKISRDFATDKFKKVRENVYSIPEGREGKQKTLFLFDQPNRIVILGPKGNDLARPHAGEKTGPIAEALAAAADGKALAFGLNFANLPDDIRQASGTPQFEPFKPILEADAIIASAAFAGEDLALTVNAKCPSRVKAVEAEKSMGVFRTLMQTLLAAGIAEMQKDEANAKLVDLGKQTQVVLKAADIGSDDTQATATLKAKADFNVTPLLVQLFGVTGNAAARSRTVNNLKQVALSMHNYEATFGSFPAAAVIGKKGKPLLSWRVSILPYVEQDQLYQKFKLDEPWDSAHNKKVFDETPMPNVFRVEGANKPEDKETHFQVFRGNGAMFDLVQGGKLAQIPDGTSNTVMIALAKKPVPWTKPDDLEFDPKGNPADLLLFTKEVTHFAFADGSVRTVKQGLPVETWRALVTKSGGEVIRLSD